MEGAKRPAPLGVEIVMELTTGAARDVRPLDTVMSGGEPSRAFVRFNISALPDV